MKNPSLTEDTPPINGEKDDRINIDGFAQVLEMLRIADPQFRESLLKRLAARDVELARSLRQDLRNAGL